MVFLVALGVEEYADNEEKMRFFPKTLKADVRYRDRRYGQS
jgi:hypothetical protein